MFLDNFTLKDAQLLLSSQQLLNTKLNDPGANEGCMFCSCKEKHLMYHYRFEILFYLKNK